MKTSMLTRNDIKQINCLFARLARLEMSPDWQRDRLWDTKYNHYVHGLKGYGVDYRGEGPKDAA